MAKPMIRIHDLETNEVIDRRMNDEEYEVHLKIIKAYEMEQIETAEKVSARKALLEKLGITEEEARILLS